MDSEELPQKTKWIQEQFDVASKVVVLPDPRPLSLSIRTTTSPENDDDDGSNKQNHSTGSNRFVEIPVVDLLDSRMLSGVSQCCYYGGVDVSFPERSIGEEHTDRARNGHNGDDDDDKDEIVPQPSQAVAVYIIIEYPSMQIVYNIHVYFDLTIPYIPSFLAVREIQPIHYLIQQQTKSHPQYTPNAIFVDGNGRFHIRNAGLACFVGVRTGIPTIGIGKTLYGCCETGRTKEFVDRLIDNSIFHCLKWYRRRPRHHRQQQNEQGHQPPPPRTTTTTTTDATLDTTTTSVSKEDNENDSSERTDHSTLSSSSPSLSRKAVIVFDCCVEEPSSIHNRRRNEQQDHHPNNNSNSPANQSTTTSTTNNTFVTINYHKQQRMKELSDICIGLAIPIADRSHNNTTTSVPVAIAYAVVGHGGRPYHHHHSDRSSRRRSSTSRIATADGGGGGSWNPIYISVGHDISLQEAVVIGCQLCTMSRIPEPIRQADLHGRALLRRRRRDGNVIHHSNESIDKEKS